MYEQEISRKNPGCVVFLLDRSDSMGRSWDGGATLAEGAANAINGILLEMCYRAQKEAGLVRHYFDIGAFGYGLRTTSGDEGVEPALGGALAAQPLVPLPVLRDNPAGSRQVASPDAGAPPSVAPVWVEPVHGCRTPMCEAIAVAGAHVYDWAAAHPESFPPIVINITDGFVTDDPYQGVSLADWAGRLTGIKTQDGPALLFNVFLAPTTEGEPKMLPESGAGLPDPGPGLFQVSSTLPAPLVASAAAEGYPVTAGSRGLAFNADPRTLVKFLQIGTRVRVND